MLTRAALHRAGRPAAARGSRASCPASTALSPAAPVPAAPATPVPAEPVVPAAPDTAAQGRPDRLDAGRATTTPRPPVVPAVPAGGRDHVLKLNRVHGAASDDAVRSGAHGQAAGHTRRRREGRLRPVRWVPARFMADGLLHLDDEPLDALVTQQACGPVDVRLLRVLDVAAVAVDARFGALSSMALSLPRSRASAGASLPAASSAWRRGRR